MGMFDYIECEMELPKFGDHPHSWEWKSDHQFQTKDLVNALIEYKIDKEGVLHYKKIEYEKKDLTAEEQKDKDSGGFWHPMWNLETVSEEWVKEDFTGYIDFYDFIHDFSEGHDAWVEYKAHVVNGKVEGGIQLAEFKEECNKERKESNARIKAEMEARKEYRQKWRYKYFGHYWNGAVRFIFGVFHRYINWKRRVADWISKRLWKLEDKLKF